MNPKMKARVNFSVLLFTEPPTEEPSPPPESLCSPSSLPPPPPINSLASPKASEIVTERLLLDVQEATEEERNSECLTTDQTPRVPSPSLSLLEAAADVASSLEDAVDAVIQSSPRARRRKLQLAENSDPMSVLQGGCFSGSSSSSSTWSLQRSDSIGRLQPGLDIDWSTHRPDPQNGFSSSVGHSSSENSTEEDQEETWDENCRQHLADFAEKLSEKLLEEIDQYQKQTCQQPPRHSNILDDHYLSRLSEELQDLTKLSEELQKRSSYLAGLGDNPTVLEMQPPSLLIQDPLNITETYDPFLETTLYPDVAVEVKSRTVVLDVYNQTEKKLDTEVNPAVSNESGDDLSSAGDVRLVCNSCSRKTSNEITEDLDICAEVVSKEDDCELQEMPQDICGETQNESISIALPAASESCHSEPSHLLGSVASSVTSLRPGYSMESSEAGDMSEQMGTSGSDCSRRDTNSADKTASTVSVELSDAVTGSSSDRGRETDIQAPLCDGRSSSGVVPPRGSALKATTQEPPEVLTKEESCASSLSGSTSQESLPSDNGGGAITFHRYYHVFREGELDQLIERYVENLHIISSYYDHANWCVVAEKVHVWTI
jgi:hypothetical protein